MGRRIAAFLAVLIAAGGFSAAAQDTAGYIVFLEGAVELQRGGEVLELWDTDIGFEIENFDLIETGPDGSAEIELAGFSAPGSRVRLASDTAFYFDLSRISGDSAADIRMLSGAVSLKVQQLTGREELNVRTESAVMGVRGTEFEVRRAPEGSVLVTCSEGRVECVDDDRVERFAAPGSIVEKRRGERLTRVDIDSGDEKLYSEYWTGKREEIFRAGAGTFVRGYAAGYSDALPRFLEADRKLAAVRDRLEVYGRDTSGRTLSELILVKSEVSDEVLMMRSILPLFEHNFYAVGALGGYHKKGIGRIEERGFSSDAFFADFSASERSIRRKLAEARYLIRLYVNISRAANPGGLDSPSFFDDVLQGSPLPTGVPESSLPRPRVRF